MSISLLRSAAIGLALIACVAAQPARADGREPAVRPQAHHPHVRPARPVQPAAPRAAMAPARATVRLADSFFTGPLTGGVGFGYGAGAPPAPRVVVGRAYRPHR